MISSNTGRMDLDDVGVLFLALVNHVEEREEVTDISVVNVGHGVLLSLAGTAAAELNAQAPDEAEDYDSCLWFERLERSDEDSLAAALLSGLETATVVRDWLLELGYAPREHRLVAPEQATPPALQVSLLPSTIA